VAIKRPERDADHLRPSSSEVNNAWSYTTTFPFVFMAWCLVKHTDNFTFTFISRVLFSLINKFKDVPVW